ncbi:MAG: sialate O-acetylesterase [Candidatus Nealsonbacteria bacterium]|nr:sialate O-acetylesterase [Candidatus Nealsonbacteria bacterium]
MKQLSIITALTVLTLAMSARAEQPGKSPLKVFILAGQSNMEGQGVVDMDHEQYYNGGKGNLEHVMRHSDKAALYKHLKDADGKWVVRDDVWVWYKTPNAGLKKGRLTIGYTSYGGSHHIGPELQIGHVLGDHFDNQVLLIKTAWGGKSLYEDFRPPSSGGQVGPYYTKMLEEVREALGDLKKHFPDYDGRGYELAGFVWFQGWNDMCTEPAVPEYEENLVNLIKDLRKEWKAPKLPVVIGELGNGGPKATGNMAKIRQAQASAAARPEFTGNAVFVETTAFARPADQSPCTGHGHHWFANAESYFLIGDALGKGMKKLLDR